MMRLVALTHRGLLSHDPGGWVIGPWMSVVAVASSVALLVWMIRWLTVHDRHRPSLAEELLLHRLASERPSSQRAGKDLGTHENAQPAVHEPGDRAPTIRRPGHSGADPAP